MVRLAISKEGTMTKRLGIPLALAMALAFTSGAARAVEWELKAAGPKDTALQTVLSYSGADLAKALAAGNKRKDSTKLNELVKVDEKDAKLGVLQWRGFEAKRNGQTIQIT